jgi:hypothetical protein
MLASEVTPGLLSGAEPDTHQFNVTVVKFGDQMEINSTMQVPTLKPGQIYTSK